MTEEDWDRINLLREVVWERENCRSWWKTPQNSGQPASSLNAAFRSDGESSREPRIEFCAAHPSEEKGVEQLQGDRVRCEKLSPLASEKLKKDL